MVCLVCHFMSLQGRKFNIGEMYPNSLLSKTVEGSKLELRKEALYNTNHNVIF